MFRPIVASAKRVAIVLCACLMAACASPYGPKGLTGGYTEVKIEPHIYKVSFDGNGYASEELVVNYWLYRCAELTLGNGYQYFGLLGSPRTSALPEPADGFDLLPKERAALRRTPSDNPGPNGDAAVMVPVRSGPVYIYVPSYAPGRTITTWHKTGTIVMFHSREGATTPEQFYSLNARTVTDMLLPFVKSGGKTPAPARKDIIDAAMNVVPPAAGAQAPQPAR